MHPFKVILTDFIKDSTKIIEEFQVQCQAITYEMANLDTSKQYKCFTYPPIEDKNKSLSNASDYDIELRVIEVSNNSPKELIITTHLITKILKNLENDGMQASKAKIRKVIDKLRSEGKIEFPENEE